MGLPKTNPIDAGWIPKGTPVDHLGATRVACKACGPDQPGERYRILFGRYVGFGAPNFVVPFLKRQSTAGKVGGTRAVFDQCGTCSSLWAADAVANDLMAKNGIEAGGYVSAQAKFDYLNNASAERLSKDQAAAAPDPVQKVRRTVSQDD